MFIPGNIYRRVELHQQFGGQRYSGISTLADYPMIWLFTGDQGELYGYHDRFHEEDGTYWYTGEGQVGDMTMTRGNSAIRDHQLAGKSLHLFAYVSTGHVRYVGEAFYTAHHTDVAADRDGNPRRVIVFELALGYPEDEQAHNETAAPPPRNTGALWKQPMDVLRKLAIQRPAGNASPAERKLNVYTRSRAVRVYVLRRAKGSCEGCELPAPFVALGGEPFLEAHHLRRRADGGPDHPRWVIALCPNCHRRVHFGIDGPAFNAELVDRVEALEGTFSGTAETPVLALA